MQYVFFRLVSGSGRIGNLLGASHLNVGTEKVGDRMVDTEVGQPVNTMTKCSPIPDVQETGIECVTAEENPSLRIVYSDMRRVMAGYGDYG